MSLFQTLSTIFKRSSPIQGDYYIPSQIDTQIPDAETSSAGRVRDDESTAEDNSAAQAAAEELISAAKQKAADILTQANSDAEFLERSGKQELAHLKLQIEEINLELTKQQKNLTIQDIIVTKKTKNVDVLQQRKQTLAQNIQDLDQQLTKKLEKLSETDQAQASSDLLTSFQQQVADEAAKEIKFSEDSVRETADEQVQELLSQIVRHGSTNYHSEFVPPLIIFDSPEEEEFFTRRHAELLKWIETTTGVEINYIPEEHLLKLYCFNTIQREVVRVMLQKLRQQRQLSQALVQKVLQQTQQDLDREMFLAGQELCQAVGVFNLPKPMVQRLGMFKYRYSYGQNMIQHTLEETRIGIALAQELNADSNVVRLGCLFHDIGKVIYDDENTNHVETGVKYLRDFKMPESVVVCVAESHEDIPFSSIESMIVHVADAISGARPGARFNDVEGFIKHQQGMIDISMSHQGVMDAYVTNGGREVRIFVDPQQVNDENLELLSDQIRDEIQEFSTFPGSIVINVIRELQHSEIKD